MSESLIDSPISNSLHTQSHNQTMEGPGVPLDWYLHRPSEHVVQFYENEPYLVQAVSNFIGTGLATGEACIVIATPEHRAAFDAQLQSVGLHVAQARESGQYHALDAAETLADLLVDRAPASERVTEILGGLIDRVSVGRKRVRIFGEMVALLWAEERYTAALQLEALWNDLHITRAFTLLCAYPIHDFQGHGDAQALSDVCVSHTRVIPAESYIALRDAEARLRAIIELQRKAQVLEAEIAERKAAEAALLTVQATLEAHVAELQRVHELSMNLIRTLVGGGDRVA